MSTLVVGTVKGTGSGAPTIHNSSGTEIGQFAGGWTSFNGSSFGDRASFNVSSLNDSGVGNYGIFWQNDFSGGNDYCVVASTQQDGSVNSSNNLIGIHSNNGGGKISPGAGECRVCVLHPANNVNQDADYVSVVAFGV